MKKIILSILVLLLFSTANAAVNIDTTATAISPIGAKIFGVDASGTAGWTHVANHVPVFVNGKCRAVKYLDSANATVRVDIVFDSAVTDYGNKDTVGSIQWALYELKNSNVGTLKTGTGMVHIGPGTFPVATEIIISSTNVTLEGSGNITNLGVVAGSNQASVIRYTNVGADRNFFCRLRNFEINGNANGQTSGTGYGIYSVRVSTGQPNDLQITDVFVQNTYGHGMYFPYSWGYRITNCLVEWCGQHAGALINVADGIKFDGGLQNYVSNCFIAYNTGIGLNLSYTAGSTLSDVNLYQNWRWGLSLTGTSGRNVVTNVTLNDNSYGQDAGGYGSLNITSTENVISNLRYSTTTKTPTYGILLQGARNSFSNVQSNSNSTGSVGLVPATDIYVDTAANNCRFSNIVTSKITDTASGSSYDSISSFTAVNNGAIFPAGVTTIDTSGNTFANTLGDGKRIGQTVTIVRIGSVATGQVNLTVAKGSSGGSMVAVFGALGQSLSLMWTGTNWATVQSTCTSYS